MSNTSNNKNNTGSTTQNSRIVRVRDVSLFVDEIKYLYSLL